MKQCPPWVRGRSHAPLGRGSGVRVPPGVPANELSGVGLLVWRVGPLMIACPITFERFPRVVKLLRSVHQPLATGRPEHRLTGGITRVILLRTMKTAISIPDDLFRAAEAAAKRLGISRSRLYSKAVKSYLKRHGAKRITEILNEVYSGLDPDSGLDPILAKMQSASIGEEDW